MTKHFRIIAIVGIASVLAAGCDSANDWGSGGESEIVGACRKYASALETGDWPAARDLLTDAGLVKWNHTQKLAMHDNRLVKSRKITYEKPVVTSDIAVVQATSTTHYKQATETTMGRIKLTVVQEITLHKVGDAWKIDTINPLEVH